jgi:hypothetical protein
MQSILFKNSNINFKALKYYRHISLLNYKPSRNDFKNSKINSFLTKKSVKLEIDQFLPMFSKLIFKLQDSFSLFKTGNIQYNKENENSQDKTNNENGNKNFRQPGPIGMIILMITFLAFNIIYTKQLEELNRKVKERENEILKLEQIKKQNPNQEVPNEKNSNNQKTANNSTGIADLQTYFGKRNHSLITWNEFVAQVLPSQQVSEVVANRKNDLVFISLKNPIIMNGVKIYYLHMNIPPEEIERKLEKAQSELNIRRENQIIVTFRDTSFSSNLVTLAVFFFLGYLVFKGVKAVSSKIKNMQNDLFSQFGKAKFSMVDPHLKAGAPKIQFKDVSFFIKFNILKLIKKNKN